MLGGWKGGWTSALLVMGVVVALSSHAGGSLHLTAVRTVSAANVGAPPGSTPVAPELPLSKPSVVAAVPAGQVLDIGNAPAYGSLSGWTLNAPVVGMARTFDGKGYWLVTADGGVFNFGDAGFYGSEGGDQLEQPVVGMAPTPTGHGYWLVAADGGVFNFGDAGFYGSSAGQALEQPVVGIVPALDGSGYWLVEGERTPLPRPFWAVFSPALVEALNQRAGIVSASVLDLATGSTYNYRPGQLGITASIVKVQILGALLAQAQAVGRGLTPTEESTAASMIELSDNDSATALWNEVGGAPAVFAFDRSVGMTSTTPALAWGLTVTTAADQVTLLQHLVEPNPVLSNGSRAYELDLMENVTPSQAWGISSGTVAGTTVALKNGWLPVGSEWSVNSIGWVSGSGRDYLIAVTTSADPDEDYGIASISMVAAAAWGALGH